MMKSKFIFLTLFILSVSGCVDKINQLNRFPEINIADSFYQIQDDIALTARAFSSQESKSHFGVDLISKGYIPIQLRIENRSPDTYIIRPSYIELAIAEPSKIAKLLHWDTYWWVTTAGCLSLLFWWPATFYVGQSGYDMYRTNKNINECINYNSICENQAIEIPPYDVLNKFIFVTRSEFTSRFRIKLFNIDQKLLLTFNVNVFGHVKNSS